MRDEAGRTRFHYGFYAAMEVEYDLANVPLIYEQEVELGKDPLRLDLLIIKKELGLKLHDPIGEFFKQVNIFEYKSPEDGLSIDDFYKIQGYGLFYKGLRRKVNELPIENITLTIVRHSYPRDMIKMLEKSGISTEKVHQGIYRFKGVLMIPVQLVVSSQLLSGEYEGLRLLAHGATVERVVSYAEKAIASGNERIKENAGTVIEVCLSVNKNLKGIDKMYEAVREVFKDFIAKERQEEINATNERVAMDMLRDGEPIAKITRYSRLAEGAVRSLAASMGLVIS